MLNKKSDEKKKKTNIKNKRIEYIYSATQFVQLVFNCGMLWLWYQGDGVKQPRPTDTHNT